MKRDVTKIAKLLAHEIIDTASLITDKKWTLEAWLGNVRTSLISADEIVCMLFDDMAIEEVIAVDRSVSELTEEQVKAMDRLREALEAYIKGFPRDYYPPEKIIASHEWDEVTQAARELVAVSENR